jgi:hypothetical protein
MNNKYPKVMWVWSEHLDKRDKRKRVVFMEKGGQFIAWAGATTLEGAESVNQPMVWDYAEDVNETEEALEMIDNRIDELKGLL